MSLRVCDLHKSTQTQEKKIHELISKITKSYIYKKRLEYQQRKDEQRKSLLRLKYTDLWKHLKNLKCKQQLFSYQGLNGQELELISFELQNNTFLTSLDLRENDFGESGVDVLARSLTHNSSLKNLDLRFNPIGDNRIATLCKSLRHNSCLEVLFIGNTQVKEKGIKELTTVLTFNKSLKELGLSWNILGDQCIVDLFQSLIHNKSLEKLWLRNTDMTDIGGRAIDECLNQNFTIKEIELEGFSSWPHCNKISPQLFQSIKLKLERNRTLKEKDKQQTNN